MPIEIRELHIKLNLGAEEKKDDSSAADSDKPPGVKQDKLLATITEILAEQAANRKER